MNDFIDKAIAFIKAHAVNVSTAAKLDDLKTVYLMGANHACDILKIIAGNDVVKVIRCRDCVYFDEKTREEIEGCEVAFCDIADGYVNETDFCSFAERKENAD